MDMLTAMYQEKVRGKKHEAHPALSPRTGQVCRHKVLG